jgi:S-(hydroxymethyl)glutathione dehydrogenase/alcohol dehydrogenase
MMRAAIFVGAGQPLAIEDVTPLAPGPNDVVVRVTASGLCHTDLSVLTGRVPSRPNVVLGHEGTGTVETVGERVTRVKPGDRVVASFVPACGSCWYCVHEQSHLCLASGETRFVPRLARADGSEGFGFTGLGTFADQMTVNEGAVVKIRSDLPDEQLALLGCGVTTGVGAVLNTARVQPGATVAVVGCGGVGQAAVQGARVAGASRIVAVDPVELKRKAAGQLGATDFVDPTDGDPVSQVRELTAGRGVDYAFEVIGSPDTMTQAYAMARRGGTVVLIGVPRVDASLTFRAGGLVYEGKSLIGCVYGSAQVRRDFQRFVNLAETGRLDLDAMVSRRLTLDEVNEGFHAMQRGEVIRSVIAGSNRG